jgi:hypothetical protein
MQHCDVTSLGQIAILIDLEGHGAPRILVTRESCAPGRTARMNLPGADEAKQLAKRK